MAGVVVVSEILVASVEKTGEVLGFGQLFVGAIIVGIVGNASRAQQTQFSLQEKARLSSRLV